MSAMMNFHSYWRDARCSLVMHTPYVLMELLLAALSKGPVCPVRVSKPVAGRTLTSAPVSTRNRRPECEFQAKSRLSVRPAAEATIGGWPAHFPTRCKAHSTV